MNGSTRNGGKTSIPRFFMKGFVIRAFHLHKCVDISFIELKVAFSLISGIVWLWSVGCVSDSLVGSEACKRQGCYWVDAGASSFGVPRFVLCR